MKYPQYGLSIYPKWAETTGILTGEIGGNGGFPGNPDERNVSVHSSTRMS